METGSQPPESSPGGQSAPATPQAPPAGGPQAPGGQPPAQYQQAGAPMGPGGVPLADYGPRVGAALLDGVIVGVGSTILYFVLIAIAGAIGDTGGIVTLIVGALAIIGASMLYAPILMKREGENNGQTIGKQVLGIRVVKEDGGAMDFGKAFVREVLIRGVLFAGVSVITFGFGGILVLLDVLWPLWDDQRRALHDMMAKTRVVKA